MRTACVSRVKTVHPVHSMSEFILSAIQRAFTQSAKSWETALSETAQKERESLVEHVQAQLKQGARLIVLPELCDLPYFCLTATDKNSQKIWKASAYPIETHPTLLALLKCIEGTGAIVCAPIYERDGENYYSTAVLLGSNLKIIGKVRKAPTQRLAGMFEREFFKADDSETGYAVFDLPELGKVGVTLSRGGKYFKAVEAMTAQGAKLILNPRSQAAGFSASILETETLMHAKNLGYALIQVNRSGTEDESMTWNWGGASLIINAQGEVLVRGPSDEAAILKTDKSNLLLPLPKESLNYGLTTHKTTRQQKTKIPATTSP